MYPSDRRCPVSTICWDPLWPCINLENEGMIKRVQYLFLSCFCIYARSTSVIWPQEPAGSLLSHILPRSDHYDTSLIALSDQIPVGPQIDRFLVVGHQFLAVFLSESLCSSRRNYIGFWCNKAGFTVNRNTINDSTVPYIVYIPPFSNQYQ